MSRKSGADDPAVTRETAQDLANAGRLKQIRMVAGLVHKANPKAMPIVIGSGLGTLVILVVVGLLTGLVAFLIPLGVLLGVLVSTILFGRFAQAAQYSAIEGQPGAAAAVLENMRGSWTVTPAIAANRNMDVVHRAVGRPGVILVGEGSANRVKPLLAQEKKRTARLIGDVPIYDIVVGNGDGEVPLAKLERHLTKLPANITVKQMDSLESRLSALGSRAGTAAMPKGPMPGNAKVRGVQRTVRRR